MIHRFFEVKTTSGWELVKLSVGDKKCYDIPHVNVLGGKWRFPEDDVMDGYKYLSEKHHTNQLPDLLSDELRHIMHSVIGEDMKDAVEDLKNAYIKYATDLKSRTGHYPPFHEERLRDNFKVSPKYEYCGYIPLKSLVSTVVYFNPQEDHAEFAKYLSRQLEYTFEIIYSIYQQTYPDKEILDVRMIYYK